MNTREILAKSFKSKLFLVLMIGLSVVCSGYIISALTSLTSDVGIIGLIINALFAIAPTISVVSGWLLFGGKVNAGNIKGVKAYSSFQKVMTVIATVFVGIFCGIIFGLAVLLVVIASEAEEAIYGIVELAEELDVGADFLAELADAIVDGAIVFAVIIAVLIAIIMFVMINLASTYKGIKKSFIRLAECYEDDNFNANRKIKYPIKRLWIFGVLYALTAIPTAFVSVSAAIPSLGTATFFIACALWFSETNNALVASSVTVDEAPAAEEAPAVEEAPAAETTAE